MADNTEITIPWYQQKKWVVSAGLACGVGLGLIFLPPVVEEIVPILLNENSSDPPAASPEPDEPATTDTTTENPPVSETTASGEADAVVESETLSDDQSEEPYELVIFDTADVSSEETILKVVSAELNLYPVDKERLREALEAELDEFQGETHAVSFRVFYDQREGGAPGFGAWDWAPEGDWSKAEEGNPETWDDYEWNEPDLSKFESPDSCDPPGDDQLVISGAYYDSQDDSQDAESVASEDPANVQDPEDDDTTPSTTPRDPRAMDEAAEEIGTTIDLLEDALTETSSWAAC